MNKNDTRDEHCEWCKEVKQTGTTSSLFSYTVSIIFHGWDFSHLNSRSTFLLYNRPIICPSFSCLEFSRPAFSHPAFSAPRFTSRFCFIYVAKIPACYLNFNKKHFWKAKKLYQVCFSFVTRISRIDIVIIKIYLLTYLDIMGD